MAIHGTKNRTTVILGLGLLLLGTSFALAKEQIEPDARAFEPSVQSSVATFHSLGGKTDGDAGIAGAALDANDETTETTTTTTTTAAATDTTDTAIVTAAIEDGEHEVEAELARLCTDDSTFRYKHLDRNVGLVDMKNCTWVATKPMVRCNFRLSRDDDTSPFLKEFCPLSCGLCPTAAQVIPCPEDIPTVPPSTVSSFGSSTSSSVEFVAGLGGSNGGAIVDNRESSVDNTNSKRSLAIALSVVFAVLLLLLLWIYCCCCGSPREGKNEDTDDEEMAMAEMDHNHANTAKSVSSVGSRLLGMVLSTFNGLRGDPKIDVHQCTSAYCDACEGERKAAALRNQSDVHRVRSVDTFERERQEKQRRMYRDEQEC